MWRLGVRVNIPVVSVNTCLVSAWSRADMFPGCNSHQSLGSLFVHFFLQLLLSDPSRPSTHRGYWPGHYHLQRRNSSEPQFHLNPLCVIYLHWIKENGYKNYLHEADARNLLRNMIHRTSDLSLVCFIKPFLLSSILMKCFKPILHNATWP